MCSFGMIFGAIHRSRYASRILLAAPGRVQAVHFGQQRGLCSKPLDEGAKPQATVTEPGTKFSAKPTAKPTFRVPGHRPSDFEKRIFIWAGRFKTKDQIPEIVSMEMLDAAKNKVRVKIAYLMVFVTIAASMVMIYLGKRAAARHESLTSWNLERKARWKEEAQRERETTTMIDGKS